MTCRNIRVAAELAAGGAIGSAMTSEILAPFRMQDVAANLAMIQRETVKRMFKVISALGVEFAKDGATVILHTPAA